MESKILFIDSMLHDPNSDALIPQGSQLIELQQRGELEEKKQDPEIQQMIEELRAAGFSQIISMQTGSIDLSLL